ncbi:MAG TPA: hypothetical protein PKE47_08915, partial [Verrucomicrobiota bacterium]|nr:hypothetical protein [Verrucomicrobiota bacterium]
MRAVSAKVFLLFLLLAAASPGARADAVLDWDALMLDAIRADTTAPTISTRNLAILHLAIYDAVNAILRTHQPYQFQPPPPPEADPVAATIGAGYEVMKSLYPTFRARTDQLYQSGVAGLPPGAATSQSLAFGADVALLTLAARQADGANTDIP